MPVWCFASSGTSPVRCFHLRTGTRRALARRSQPGCVLRHTHHGSVVTSDLAFCNWAGLTGVTALARIRLLVNQSTIEPVGAAEDRLPERKSALLRIQIGEREHLSWPSNRWPQRQVHSTQAARPKRLRRSERGSALRHLSNRRESVGRLDGKVAVVRAREVASDRKPPARLLARVRLSASSIAMDRRSRRQ